MFLPDTFLKCGDDGPIGLCDLKSDSVVYTVDKNFIFPSFSLNALGIVSNLMKSGSLIITTGESGILHYSSSFLKAHNHII